MRFTAIVINGLHNPYTHGGTYAATNLAFLQLVVYLPFGRVYLRKRGKASSASARGLLHHEPAGDA